MFSTVSTTPSGRTQVVTHTRPCPGRLWTIALCTRFVVICSSSAREPVGGRRVAGGFDGDAALLCQREECFGGFLRDERQVDGFSAEGPLVGAAEQQQCLGEVDRPGVDGVEAVDELVGVAVRIVAGDFEQGLRGRQWRAQFVGGVGREPLLFGNVRFEPGEHRVEAVGELAELVVAAREPDPMRERAVRQPLEWPR